MQHASMCLMAISVPSSSFRALGAATDIAVHAQARNLGLGSENAARRPVRTLCVPHDVAYHVLQAPD